MGNSTIYPPIGSGGSGGGTGGTGSDVTGKFGAVQVENGIVTAGSNGVTVVDTLPTAGTTGVGETTDLNASPTADSTRTLFARRDTLNWNCNFKLKPGAWLTAHEAVLNISGSGEVSKTVISMAQGNVNYNGKISIMLGYEPVLSSINPEATIEQYCSFYHPNMQVAVPNIGRVLQRAAFICEDTEAYMRTVGIFLNGNLQEFAPSMHPGLIPDRYYSAPYRTQQGVETVPNFAMICLVNIPHRATIKKLGINVLKATPGGKVRLAMYSAVNGRVEALKGQTAELDCSTTGEKEGDLNVRVEAGNYWLCVNSNAAIPIAFHIGASPDRSLGLYGATASTQVSQGNMAFVPMGGYAAFPASIVQYPSFLNQDAEPHIWFRV